MCNHPPALTRKPEAEAYPYPYPRPNPHPHPHPHPNQVAVLATDTLQPVYYTKVLAGGTYPYPYP